MSTELKRVLDSLNAKYGTTRLGRHKTEYVAVDKTIRKEVIWYLVKTMEKRGKDRIYFEMPSVQEDISEFFFPSAAMEGWTKDKSKGAKAVVIRELSEVLAKVWPEEGLFEDKPNFDSPVEEKEPEFKPVGRDINPQIYSQEEKPQLDEEWAKLMGVTQDE